MKKILLTLVMILSLNLSANDNNPHVIIETTQGKSIIKFFKN